MVSKNDIYQNNLKRYNSTSTPSTIPDDDIANTQKPNDLINEETRKLLYALRNTADKEEILSALNAQPNSAMLTLTGYKGNHSINQDGGILTSNEDILMGVMDGHGTKGELVTYHTIQQLPHVLQNNLNEQVE